MMRKLSILIKRDSPKRERATSSTWSQFKVTPFVYTSLQDVDEIRLLCIAPRTERADNIGLTLTIQHVRLSASPLYAAVSWTWGRSGDMVDILVDGQILTIQRNLSKILEHLQDDYQTRRVWVDAICIDQQRLEERNHQVQLMGNIYSRANYVIACLTAGTQRDSRRLQFEARELHKALKEGRLTYTSEYRRFFGNLYFTRRWIIQEISQAQSVTFCCEGYHVPMSLISDGLQKFRLQSKPENSREYSFFTKAERAAEMRATQLCRMQPTTPRNPSSMESLLYSHETAECSDFHDKIYALLSLTSEAQMHLLVQYDIDKAQLMLSVLRVCLIYEDLSMFRTLSFACFLRQHLDIRLDDLREAVLKSATPRFSTTFAIRGVVHGKIENLQTGSYVEEAALRFRNNLDALHVHQTLSLKVVRLRDFESVDSAASKHLEIDRMASPAALFHPTAEISAIDQCLFAFIGNETVDTDPAVPTEEFDSPPAYTTANGPQFVGFASAKVAVDDEVWQFDRTPVAVIARKSLQGYDLIGRAYLIRDLNDSNHGGRVGHFPKKFEEQLFWVRDGTKYNQLTPTISVDFKGLYELMSWVTLDH